MAKPKPRVRVPKSADKGEVIEIKTLISHPMESGQRKDRKTGELIPRKIINKFVCTYNGEEVFSVDLHPAVTIFVVFVGGQLLGFLGMIVAVPLASIIIAVLQTLYKEFSSYPTAA